MAILGEANVGGRMVPAWLLNMTAEELDNLRTAVCRRNLLDNWYFAGGGSQQGGGQFPINQRGQTSYTNVTNMMYGIDMWILDWNTTLTLASGYASMTGGGGIFQALPSEKISLITGKTVTLSALDVSGNLYVVTGVYDENTSPPGNGTIKLLKNYGGKSAVLRIVSSGIVAAKLELGSHQTLAYQDEDGNWQLFETPDYGEELAKCQRYYLPIDGIGRFPAVFSSPSTILQVFIPTPVTMRSVPTVLGITSLSARVYTGAANSQTLSVSEVLKTETGVQIIFSCSWPGSTSPAAYSNAVVVFGQRGALSAEL